MSIKNKVEFFFKLPENIEIEKYERELNNLKRELVDNYKMENISFGKYVGHLDNQELFCATIDFGSSFLIMDDAIEATITINDKHITNFLNTYRTRMEYARNFKSELHPKEEE